MVLPIDPNMVPPEMMEPQMEPPMMGDPMMAMPEPVMAPPPPPPPDPFLSAMSSSNPLADLLSMYATDMPSLIPPPRYPAGYKKPPKPDPSKIKQEADRLWEQHRGWRALIYATLRWVSQDLTGMFPEDAEDRLLGYQEEFVSSALSDEFNLIVSKLATLQPGIKKLWTKDENKAASLQITEAAHWLLDEISTRHSWAGNRAWGMDVGSLFAGYGMAVSRQVLLPNDPDFPLDVTLIDPCQVYPVWGGRNGLRAVYRVYRDTIANIVAAYGDIAPTAMKQLEKRYGSDITDESELSVIEYWDTWWRCVLIDDVPVLPVTAHEYGYVPYTIQYGGFGEPMFTRLPSDGKAQKSMGEWIINHSTRTDERVRKAVPAIYYQLRRHEKLEAVMARLITGFKKEINPPVIRYRSNMAAEKGMPPLDTSPGMQNEAMLGEERIEPFPVSGNGPATAVILQSLLADKNTGSMPMAAFGNVDRSNVTGAALSQLSDAGMDKLVPHVKGLEHFTSQMLSQCLLTIRNWGHLATYGGPETKPLLVPVRKPGKGSAPAFELTPDVIDKAGERVKIEFRKIDPRDWTALFNAGMMGVQGGFATRSQIVELAHGIGDYDRFLEEWLEEDAIFKTSQHPKYNEIFNIPFQIAAQMREVEGNPEMMALYQQMLAAWQQIVMQPAQNEQQLQMGQMQMAQQQMMQPPQPPGGGPQFGPSTQGVSLPSLGMGPGSQGAPVGRPPGAM